MVININIFLIIIYLKLKNRGNHLGFLMPLKIIFQQTLVRLHNHP